MKILIYLFKIFPLITTDFLGD